MGCFVSSSTSSQEKYTTFDIYTDTQDSIVDLKSSSWTLSSLSDFSLYISSEQNISRDGNTLTHTGGDSFDNCIIRFPLTGVCFDSFLSVSSLSDAIIHSHISLHFLYKGLYRVYAFSL